MNLKNLFRLTAVLFMLTGLLWLLMPETTVASYGPNNIDPFGVYLVQILGTFNISLAILAFMASRTTNSEARQGAVITIILQQVLSAVVNLLAVLGGVIPNGAGWFGVALNMVFVLAYGYFGFVRTKPTAAPELQT